MIEISDLTIRYGQKKAIDQLSLKIGCGESILLAGANGSGKTTLLRAIIGVLFYREGRVLIDGRKMNHKMCKKIAYIPASISLYDSMKIKEAIQFHAHFYRPFSYLEIAGISFAKERKIATLSKGEKTLFFLSMALSSSPNYLFIDDVIHFLDPHLREIFLKTILQLIEEQQLSVIIAAQSSFDIEGIIERVVVLNKGKVAVDENLEKLKSQLVKTCVKEIPPHLPVIFSRTWQGMKELFLYPYDPGLKEVGKVEYLTLAEILRALIGGEYDSH